MDLPLITDETMRARLGGARGYSLIVLHRTPQYHARPDTPAIVWEHARRNFALREAGLLSIVCPISDESDVSGIGLFNAGLAQVQEIMDGDPGVQAGIFTYEAHACRGFPGDRLAGATA